MGGLVRSRGRAALGQSIRRLAMTRPGLKLLSVVLKEDALHAAVRMISDRNAAAASFQRAMPDDLRTVNGFDDLWWLYDQSEMSHGLSRLRIGEAAFFWQLARARPGQLIAEVGVYRGGTTFLLAAAGARVVAIEADEARHVEDMPALDRALEQAGLHERVAIHLADGTTFPLEPSSFDVVILDVGGAAEAFERAFDRWWHALKPGGDLVTRSIDPRDRGSDVMVRACERLSREHSDALRLEDKWQWAHFRRVEANAVSGGAVPGAYPAEAEPPPASVQ